MSVYISLWYVNFLKTKSLVFSSLHPHKYRLCTVRCSEYIFINGWRHLNCYH